MNDPLTQARDHFLRGVAAFEAGDDVAARAAFVATLTLAPGRPSVMVNLAATLLRLRDFAAARGLLLEIVAIEPENREARVQLGLCEEALGHWAAAAAALESGLPATASPELWLVCSHCHGRAGKLPAALAAIDRVLALLPDHAAAWSTRGGLLRELGRLPEAADAYRRALAHGGDPELNRYYLAAVGGDAQPATTPSHYVQALFDDYAPDFQQHLVDGLRYQGHRRLIEPLLQAGRRYPAAVDLGCGTGLCGELLRPLVDAIDGIDLSAAMLEQARGRGIYRHLERHELNAYLAARTTPADLFVAADVFGYIGDLAPAFAAVRRLLRAGGCFAFTVEQLLDGGDYTLQPCLRYRHSEDYVRRLAAQHGFTLRELAVDTLRHDQQTPIPALYVYLA